MTGRKVLWFGVCGLRYGEEGKNSKAGANNLEGRWKITFFTYF
jgi:hypothetical protein